MLRVVSLVPSITETLMVWGHAPVACTRFCEQPGHPNVGGTKDPDIAAVVALAPDLVVLDEEENRREDYEALVGAGLDVLALAVRRVADVAPALAELAGRIGRESAEGEAPLSRLRTRRRRAFVPIWRHPWIALGEPTYGADLLSHLGVDTVFDAEGPYPHTTLEEATAREPDLVLAPSEPYPFSERQRDELARVAPVVFLDGRDLFWWGVRTPGAAARLRAMLVNVAEGLGARDRGGTR